MPIGSTNVYNPGDLILSTVSGSGTSFIETKIAAATSSLILFNSNGTLTSASLNSTTVGTSSYVSGSTSIITSITASAISASGKIQANQLTASSILASNGPLMVTGSNAYVQMFPVGGFSLPTNLTASYIYTSGSTNDLYFTQYQGPYTNTTRLRWLESNLYTGILNGGVLTSTLGSTTFAVSEGEGIIVSMNAFTASAPYPTVKMVSWPTSTQSIINSGSAKITYVGINDVGGIVQQTNAWGSTDINQWDTQIALGVVLHLSGSVSSGVFNSPQISYGSPQQADDFFRAFGPLKISGHVLQASGSSPTLSIKKTGGTAYREGVNYLANPNHPSTAVENAINTSKIYRYYVSGSTPVIDTGVANAGYTTIDNDKYVNTATGLLATVGNSNWTIQRVFWIPNSPTNAFIVYYGNASYSTLLNAVNAKDSEPFTEAPNTSLNAIFVGYIIIEGGAGRDLLNADECTIIQGGLFRNVGGIGSSGTSPVSTTLAGLSDVALAGLAEGDLLVYGGGQWNNNKTLNGNYTITGSLTVQSGITGNLTGTSSWASNARTASYLTPSNSYTITSLTASTVSASGAIIASSFTGSFSGSIGNAVSAISASYALSASFASNTISSSYSLTSSFATTAQTANALNTGNSYTIAGLTNNGTLSQQGTLSMGSGYQILATTGTVTSPSLSFVGDTNTGLYSPGADTLVFSTSGSERIRIDDGGNVGIGTSTIGTLFHVRKAANGNNWAWFAGNTGATLPSTYTYGVLIGSNYSNGSSESNIVWGHGISSNQYFAIGKVSGSNVYSEQLRIDINGNVGIGTSGPVDKLHVIGNTTLVASDATSLGSGTKIRFYRVSDGWEPAQIEQIWTGTALQGVLAFKTNTNTLGTLTTKMVIDNNGNVGIGTTSPVVITDIQGTNVTLYAANYVGSVGTMYLRGNDAYNSGTAGAGIYLRGKYDSSSNVTTFGAISVIKENDIDGNYAGALTFLSRTNGQGSGAAEKMRIDSNGNVGIGTTSPGALLELSSSTVGNLVNIKGARGNNILYVSGSGAVGINSSNFDPLATEALLISGSTYNIISADTNINTYGQIHTQNRSSGNAASSDLVATNNNGNESGNYVDMGINSSGYTSGFIGNANDGYLYNTGSQFYIGNAGLTGNLYFFAGGTTNTASMMLSASGNVGIGTTSATNKLHVVGEIASYKNGSDAIQSQLYLANAGNTQAYNFQLNSAGTSLDLWGYDNANGWKNNVTFGKSGNVGIGTSTSILGKLQLNSDVAPYYGPATSSATPNGIFVLGSLSGDVVNTFGVDASSTAYAWIQPRKTTVASYSNLVLNPNGGNVGIGTTSPIAKLDVSGSSRFGVTSTNTHQFSGSVSVSNNITCLSLTETSTEAVKYNIIPLPSQLENVLKLTPVSFNYKTNDKHSIGLIAEEVAKIYPEFTSDNNDSISYGKITSVLIQSIKELKTIIDNQQKQIEDLVNKLK